MGAFRNILCLSIGDFIAKTLNFLSFIYLARVLEVSSYGVLEFAIVIVAYFLFFADSGVELWATREVSRGGDVRRLVERIVPMRILLSLGSFCVLLALLPLFPNYSNLTILILLFGCTLFIQAANLKWVFMGQEHMIHVAAGLVMSQLVFALGVFGWVHDPERIHWVPILRLAGEFVAAAYLLGLYVKTYGGLTFKFAPRESASLLKSSLTLGASHGLALMSYNFDSVLLGFLLTPMAVGWYNAAYKPVTVVLAMPVTYFLGLFPALTRSYTRSDAEFNQIVTNSFWLTSTIAVPVGVAGSFMAGPVIETLFGSSYANSVPVLQILSWSAALVILRGTYRQALNAAGRAQFDLRCACTSISLNVALNLAFIPRYGIIGAAAATLISEALWLGMASFYFRRNVARIHLLPFLLPPTAGALAMTIFFLVAQSLYWMTQVLVAGMVYVGTLFLVGAKDNGLLTR